MEYIVEGYAAPMTPPPDATLVARLLPPAITSERRALHAEEIVGIFSRLRNPLLRYLIAFGISAYEGEEIIQEAFLALFRHLQGGKSRANLQGWLASKSQVCGTDSRAENWQVPEELKQAVFAEYGLQDAPRDQYEVDFLITPELGGSASIRNLWPEPYFSRAWNAHVKDALEDRLHQLVCTGALDLSTAQREIATNWVDAYKKYVPADRPM